MSPANDPSGTHRLAWTVDSAVFLLAPLVTVALYLPNGLMMPVRVVTAFLAVVALVQVCRHRRLGAPALTWTAVGLFCLMGSFGLIAMVRYRQQASITDAVHFSLIAVSVITLAILTTRRRTIVALLAGWLFSSALAAAVGLWEVASGNHLPGNSPAQQYGDLPGWNEISSFFDNPNLYAYHLTVVLLMLPIGWSSAKGRWRAVIIVFAALLFFLLIRTHGRMALVALVVGALWWACRSRWGRVIMAAGVVLTAVTMALKVPPGWQVYRFAYVALDGLQWEGKSTWVRAQLVKSGWWMTQQSDYLGVGPGGYSVQSLSPENPFKVQELNNAHWGMVEVMSEYGIVSLVAVLTALALAVVFVLRALRTIPVQASFDRAVAHAAGLLALTIPLISISHSTWLRQPLTAVHLATLAALLAWTEVCSRRKDVAIPQ
ncbi:O-antigen ligase family protein [Tessaracoccus sp.]